MVQRWRWATLAMLLLVCWTGCSSGRKHDAPPRAAAGAANAAGRAAGGRTSDGGDAGALDEGGTSAARGGGAGSTPAGGRGQAGASAVAGMGAAAGVARPPVPLSWSCSRGLYADGTCHCGCGINDPDCQGGSVDLCEVCNAEGSCNRAECPGNIQEDSNALCVSAPPGWHCNVEQYADGESCDCGCGLVDPDCDDETADSCDVCACGSSACPGLVDPANNAVCVAPPHWTCSPVLFGDGPCDCGCGVLDVDCADATSASCDTCSTTSCTPFDCRGVRSDDNALCISAPFFWTCARELYADGAECDCGCGYQDPDCEANDIRDCDQCDAEGSCSAHSCPGTIDLDNVGYCKKLTPPAGWTCSEVRYADGSLCDCGCGVQDPDCKTTAMDWCERCGACGGNDYCPDHVDPSNTTRCIPAPDEWLCNADRYGDGTCDCGCGILDLDCYISFNYCVSCPVEGCGHGDCLKVDADDNTKCNYEIPAAWTCGKYYFDGVCDCGCGAQDRDCTTLGRDACDSCDTPGSCSDQACAAGAIKADDNTSCE